MQEYTLKPAILPPKAGGWRRFHDGKTPPTASASGEVVAPAATEAVSAADSTNPRARLERNLKIFKRAARTTGLLSAYRRNERPKMAVFFSSVSGTAAAAAKRIYAAFSGPVRVSLVNLASWDHTVHVDLMRNCTAAVFVTSTYGSGAPPPDAVKFLKYLVSELITKLLMDSSA